MTDDELRVWIPQERARLERSLASKREMVNSDNAEIRLGSQTFIRKYERELALLRLAEQSLTLSRQEGEGGD